MDTVSVVPLTEVSLSLRVVVVVVSVVTGSGVTVTVVPDGESDKVTTDVWVVSSVRVVPSISVNVSVVGSTEMLMLHVLAGTVISVVTVNVSGVEKVGVLTTNEDVELVDDEDTSVPGTVAVLVTV